MRKTFTPKQKASAAMEALKGAKTINQLASQYSVHPNVIGQWKKIFLENMESVFENKKNNDAKQKEALIEELYKTIGQKETELSWLKKKMRIDP